MKRGEGNLREQLSDSGSVKVAGKGRKGVGGPAGGAPATAFRNFEPVDDGGGKAGGIGVAAPNGAEGGDAGGIQAPELWLIARVASRGAIGHDEPAAEAALKLAHGGGNFGWRDGSAQGVGELCTIDLDDVGPLAERCAKGLAAGVEEGADPRAPGQPDCGGIEVARDPGGERAGQYEAARFREPPFEVFQEPIADVRRQGGVLFDKLRGDAR